MLRRSRFVPLLVVGLIVFAFTAILATPAAAVSNTRYGLKVSFASDSGSTFAGFGISADCTGGATWKVTRTGLTDSYSVRFNAQCKQVMVAWKAQGGRSIRLVGLTDAGAACTRVGTASANMTSPSWWDEAGTISVGTQTVASPVLGALVGLVPNLSGVCNPTRIHSDSGRGGYWSAPISLGKRPSLGVPGVNGDATNKQCPAGTPTVMRVTSEVYPQEALLKYKQFHYTITGAEGGFRDNWTANNYFDGGDKNREAKKLAVSNWPGRTGQTQLVFSNTLDEGRSLVHIGSTLVTSPPTPVWPLVDPDAAPGSIRLTADGKKVYGPGRTVPAACLFWFGKKLYDDGEPGGEDEPWGSLADEPAWGEEEPPAIEEPAGVEPTNPEAIIEPEEACEFDLSDPGSWLSGGMCSAVGLLGRLVALLLSILNGVLGLPGAILDAIAAVFVPEPGVLEGHMTGVRDAWSESSPGVYFTAFGSVANAARFSSSGCAGPSFTFSMPGGFGASQTVRPMDACDGGVATVAGVVKAGLTLTAYIGAALVALRVLGAAFGLNLNGVGAGRDD